MFRRLAVGCIAALLAAHAVTAQGIAQTETPAVQAVVETAPVPSRGDAADDPALWIHPTQPELSLVIGTDKGGGLATYDLEGRLVQYIEMTKPNNVDLRYGFPLAGRAVDIAAVSERGDDSIVVFAVDPETRLLARVTPTPVAAGFEIYGLCMYHSAVSGRYYVFANAKSGEMGQWELQDDGEGNVTGRLVRSFHVGTQVEGCVADDELGWLYVGEESVALWKRPAEPDADPEEEGPSRSVVDLPQPRGAFVPDIEGLALYTSPDGAGFLIASSQGDSTFAVYRREGDNAYVGSFRIGAGDAIDAVSGTDGIEATPRALGARFPSGVFIAQDDEDDSGSQNFKLVPWQAVADALQLR